MDVICSITNQKGNLSNCYRLDSVSIPVKNLIKLSYPHLKDDSYISVEQIVLFRKKYLNNLI